MSQKYPESGMIGGVMLHFTFVRLNYGDIKQFVNLNRKIITENHKLFIFN